MINIKELNKNVENTMNNISLNRFDKPYEDLTLCPDYWGGFEFTPYYIEFWQGHQSRINRRVVFEKNSDSWDEYFLEP